MKRAEPSQIGPYRILRRIGEGGMGIVYEALHQQIERRVAIKCLNSEYAADEEAMQRFFNEARAANRISHPSIVQISDYGTSEDGSAFIVMELLEGQTLAARLRASASPLPLSQTLTIGWQVASALAAAHDKQIVHRDLKPENIMLIADPMAPGRERAKLLDFGVAKLAHNSASQTAASVLMGTPRYMSPEQCKGAAGIDDRADVYSLGVMLFEMLSGRPPFAGEGVGELIAQHLYKAPPPLRPLAKEAPQALITLVETLLRKTPSERPSMREVSEALEQLATEQGAGGARPSRAMPRLQMDAAGQPPATSTLRGELNLPSRSGLLIWGSALLGGLLLLVVVALLRPIPSSSPPVSTAQSQPPPEPGERGSSTAVDLGNSPVVPAVLWRIDSVPPGADVLRPDGSSLGQTPLRLTRPALVGKTVVTLRLSGYREATLELDPQLDEQRSERLLPLSPRSDRGQRLTQKAKKKSAKKLTSSPPAKATSYED